MLKNTSRNFPKILPIMLLSVPIMLSLMLPSCQQFLALLWKFQSNDCSIRVIKCKATVLLKSIDQSREMFFCSLNISLIALLESIIIIIIIIIG